MHLVIDAQSASEYWTSDLRPAKPHYVAGTGSQRLTSFEETSSYRLSKAMERTAGIRGTLHLLVEGRWDRRWDSGIVCSAWGKRPLAPGSLCEIGDGILVVSPELCLARIATRVPRLELLRLMSDFMGIYCKSNADRLNLVQREPITNIEAIRRYYEQPEAKGIPGSADVMRALSWVKERVASPRETSMSLMLALPSRVGGMNLSGFEANRVIPLSDEAKLLTSRKEYVIGDAVFDDYSTPGKIKGPVLEYNSNTYHDTEEQQVMDFEKITALQCMGITVIPISTAQFNSYDAFAEIAAHVRELTGVREGGDSYYRTMRDLRRRSVHDQLLALERRQREKPSLAETARWSFLGPYLYDWRLLDW